MSVNEGDIELLTDPHVGRSKHISVKVRYNYPDSSPVELNLTLGPISSEDEFWRILEDSYFYNRPSNAPDPQVMLKDVKAKHRRKVK